MDQTNLDPPGGQVWLRSEVGSLTMANGLVTGAVIDRGGQVAEVGATVVISDVGPAATVRLAGPHHLPRLMLSREQIAEMVRLFLPASSNEARLSDQIDTYIHKAVELGFLRQVKGSEQVYEVRRILKAFVDGQWLADFQGRLAEYAALLSGDEATEGQRETG